MLENLTGVGVNSSGNPDGRGALSLTYILRGNFRFHRCFNRFNLISFQEIALPFQILLFF